MARPSKEVTIRYALQDDYGWLHEQDKGNVSPDWTKRCIEQGEYIVAEWHDMPGDLRGFIRFSLFWGKVPYLDMIRVVEGNQFQGIGSALVHFWEDQMRKRGYKMLMASSDRDEMAAQNWHWRNHYREAGKLDLGLVQPAPEVFFIKEL